MYRRSSESWKQIRGRDQRSTHLSQRYFCYGCSLFLASWKLLSEAWSMGPITGRELPRSGTGPVTSRDSIGRSLLLTYLASSFKNLRICSSFSLITLKLFKSNPKATPSSPTVMTLPTFDRDSFISSLDKIASSQGCNTVDQKIALELDNQDELKSLRDSYILPSMRDAGVEGGGELLLDGQVVRRGSYKTRRAALPGGTTRAEESVDLESVWKGIDLPREDETSRSCRVWYSCDLPTLPPLLLFLYPHFIPLTSLLCHLQTHLFLPSTSVETP